MRDNSPSDDVRGARRARDESDELDVVLEAPSPEPPASGSCPYCRSGLTESPPIVICRACHTPHHRECWQDNGGCTTYGCEGAPRPQDIASRQGHADDMAAEPPLLPLHGVPPLSERVAWALALASWAVISSVMGALGLMIGRGVPLLGLCIIGIILADRALCLAKSHDAGATEVTNRALWAIGLAAFIILVAIGRWLTTAAGPAPVS